MPPTRHIELPALDAVAIGQRVRELRKKAGWLQRDLALRSRIDPGVIGLIETGKRLPSRDCAIRLAVVFRRSLEHILFGLPRNGKLWNLQSKRGHVRERPPDESLA